MALANPRVARDVAVVDSDRKDLCQQIDVHVDRAGRQRPRSAAVAAPEAVDVGDHDRLAALAAAVISAAWRTLLWRYPSTSETAIREG